MKIASLKHGRDGHLVVVSRDLKRAADAAAIAPTMQAVLDNWREVEPRLRLLSQALENGEASSIPFRQSDCAAPLPRAYQWIDGSAYVNHVELVRKARGVELPESFWTDPLMYQGGSDGFLGPHDDIELFDEAWGADFEGELAVVTDDVSMGCSREQAIAAIRLVMMVNDVSLRNLIPQELGKGFGFLQSKPASSFSPVAVTPEELGDAWIAGRVNRPLECHLNGRMFGRPEAGVDMTFDFGALITHAAKTRRLCAGTIVGSGTVSNRGPDGGAGRKPEDGGVGHSCLAELRMVETLRDGIPSSPFLRFGNIVRIEMKDAAQRSIFGAIEQRLAPARATNGGTVNDPRG